MHKRNIIILNHIFKNAGSTIVGILRNNFQECFVDFTKLIDDGVTTIAELPKYIQENPTVSAMEVHHFFYDRFNMDGMTIYNILFLRNPFSRLRSTYDYFKRTPGSVFHAASIGMSFKEFVHFLAYEYGRYHCDNQMLRILNNEGRCTWEKWDTEKLTDRMLFDTINKIKTIEVLGIVERFDESIILAEDILRKGFPNIDMSYLILNNTPHGEKSTDYDSHIVFRELLGDTLYDDIKKRNEFDIELIERVDEELNLRIGKTEDFDKKTRDFKSRLQNRAVN